MFVCALAPTAFFVYLLFASTSADTRVNNSRYEYLGCFLVQDIYVIAEYDEDLGNNTSPEVCISLCKEKGFVYAGLQYRTQCICGDEDPELERRVDDKECSFKCPGDKKYNCGADWRTNLYKTGVTDTQISDKRYEYLGCFLTQEIFAITQYDQDLGNNTSPEVCVSLCKEKSFVYAGLQYSTECICGDEDPELEKRVDDKECKAKCPGDKRYNCGADWRTNLYSTGVADSLISDSRYKYVGCFPVQEVSEIEEYYEYLGNSTSPEVCVNLCKEKNFVHAGLRYSTQCFCGDQDPELEKRVDDKECKAKCPGDKRYNCGADWRTNLYSTGVADSLISDSRYTYLGCFPIQGVSDEHNEELFNNTSPEVCINLCKGKNFVYAGLRYRTDCFCGDQHPELEKRVDDKECITKCPGDKRYNCGAAWRANLYKTEAIVTRK